MTTIQTELAINGVTLHCHTAGDGPPVVFVHGGLTDHSTWHAVAHELAASFHVVAYDRRGHSRSGPADGPRAAHEDDLAALIEALDLAPAHVVGTSYGASIALALAIRRPELVRCVLAHEPPLLDLAPDDAELGEVTRRILGQLRAIAERIRVGDAAGGVEAFIDQVTLGPGTWARLPGRLRRTMIANAGTLVATVDDPDWAGLDASALTRDPRPVLLTTGDRSPRWFAALADDVARRAPHVRRHTFAGAGHVPHLTNPDEFVETVGAFIGGSAGLSAGRG